MVTTNKKNNNAEKQIYISGGISGYPDGNADAFNAAEAMLIAEGYAEVYNPIAEVEQV
jgi:Domain of unknown function (DUF4406)